MRTVLPAFAVLFALTASAPAADAPAKRTPREALQPFNDLIGSWKGSGTPEGSRADKQNGAWKETISWEWQFKNDDAWLKLDVDKGKHWLGGQLRYLADKDAYQLTLQTPDKESVTFEGKLSERTLTLEREDAEKKEAQRFLIRLLHDNRYLYQYEVKAKGKALYTRVYQVGATKEGTVFANNGGPGGPECIVSGGLGTIKVMYKGQTYYVCCGGCKDAFLESPEKFIKEFEAKQKGK